MKIANNLTELIGNTPLVRLTNYRKKYNLKGEIVVKIEAFNPLGSVKDRAALSMITEAENSGQLKEGGMIIEPTSGNTGIGLAYISAIRGYRLVLTMPETMSIERRKLLKMLGAEIVLTPGKEGMKGAIDAAKRLQEENPGSFIPNQFENPANPAIHRQTTAEEIWRDTDGRIDYFVAGVGSGGTIAGTLSRLKEYNKEIRGVAVEPALSPVLSGGKAGPHGIQGIGAGFIPKTLDVSLLDEIITVTNEESYEAARQVAKTDGILVGISAGAAIAAATKIALREEAKDKRIVALLADTGERYLSTPLFD